MKSKKQYAKQSAISGIRVVGSLIVGQTTKSNFFLGECLQVIIRLKKTTKVWYKQQEIEVGKLAKKIPFSTTQKVTKIKKDKPVTEIYDIGALSVIYKKGGKSHQPWLVISRNRKHGGYCYLMVKTESQTAMEVAKWAFEGYGLRWKIEEYHRHVKKQYQLEYIQIKTFAGLQSMLAVLTVAMYMIYRKIRSIHFDLLLDSGYNYLNKHHVRELVNFIYYKITKVVSILLMPVKSRWKIDNAPQESLQGQLQLMFQ